MAPDPNTPVADNGGPEKPGDNDEVYLLRLYITGMTPRSVRAIENIRAVCEDHLKDRYELQVIDVYKQPGLATDEQIIASPTLVKRRPSPPRRMIGDLSNTDRVLTGLDLPNER